MRLLIVTILTILAGQTTVVAQKLSGQWTGGFNSRGDIFSGGTEYVLELEVRGDDVTGYSYTYFIIGGKRCYVICRLTGSYEKGSKSVTVTEVEKIKSNTPPDFRDCLQTHMLTFLKEGERELLKGKWKGATPKDLCGVGETELERKALVKVSPPKETKTGTEKKSVPPAVSQKPASSSRASTPGTAKTNTAPTRKPAPSTSGGTAQKNTVVPKKPETAVKTKPAPGIQKPLTVDKPKKTPLNPAAPGQIDRQSISKLQDRTKQIIKTIELPEPKFQVLLYDNGQIDGDTVSLYYNGRLMISRQKLSTKPIVVELEIDSDRNENDLVMYAENLGEIPPNTALMIVTVGEKRYEVNITSTEQTNGTVRFKLRE